MLAWWFERGRAVALPDVAGAELPCVSYAPFRRAGQTPFDAQLRIPRAQIEQDLRILRGVTRCVRTYGLGHGLEAVPSVARELGLRVRLGAWIGRDAQANAAEVDRAAALAREYADVIEMLIIGNEVLLRRELEPAALATWLDRARRQAGVPVSYADVWEFWQRHSQALKRHVDVATIHVLPYWEDEPVAIGAAVAHVYAITTQMRAHFAPLRVWVGETGWPAAGRQRGGARPGRVEQARFVRELVARIRLEPLDVNLVEAFDQPWKRALEGAMGGAWGLYDAAGRARFPWRGALQDDPAWQRGPLAALLAALAAAVAAGLRGRSARELAFAAFGSALIGAVAVAHAETLEVWSRTPAEWALALALALVMLASATASAWRLTVRDRPRGANADLPQGDTAHAPQGASAVAPRGAAPNAALPGIVAAYAGSGLTLGVRLLAVTRFAALFSAAAVALPLVFDARYRELAWTLLAAPAPLWVALRLAGQRLDAGAREERVLACVMAACAVAIAGQEGLANAQALAFALLLALMAAAVVAPHRGSRGRANTSSASNTAGAAKVAQ